MPIALVLLKEQLHAPTRSIHLSQLVGWVGRARQVGQIQVIALGLLVEDAH
jgi:hypothetical protein